MLYLYKLRQFGFRYIIAINFFYYNIFHNVAKTIKFTYKFKGLTFALFIKKNNFTPEKGVGYLEHFVLEF